MVRNRGPGRVGSLIPQACLERAEGKSLWVSTSRRQRDPISTHPGSKWFLRLHVISSCEICEKKQLLKKAFCALLLVLGAMIPKVRGCVNSPWALGLPRRSRADGECPAGPPPRAAGDPRVASPPCHASSPSALPGPLDAALTLFQIPAVSSSWQVT